MYIRSSCHQDLLSGQVANRESYWQVYASRLTKASCQMIEIKTRTTFTITKYIRMFPSPNKQAVNYLVVLHFADDSVNLFSVIGGTFKIIFHVLTIPNWYEFIFSQMCRFFIIFSLYINTIKYVFEKHIYIFGFVSVSLLFIFSIMDHFNLTRLHINLSIIVVIEIINFCRIFILIRRMSKCFPRTIEDNRFYL